MTVAMLAPQDRRPSARPDEALLRRLRSAVDGEGPEAMLHVLRVAAQVKRARAAAAARAAR